MWYANLGFSAFSLLFQFIYMIIDWFLLKSWIVKEISTRKCHSFLEYKKVSIFLDESESVNLSWIVYSLIGRKFQSFLNTKVSIFRDFCIKVTWKKVSVFLEYESVNVLWFMHFSMKVSVFLEFCWSWLIQI